MSLRSHSNGGHQPHARQLPPERSAREHRPEFPRSGPEAEISPVKPARRLVARSFATINAPYRNLPGAQVPPAILRKSPRFRAARGRRAYSELVHETDGFVEYFTTSTPLSEIGELNIGSRPASRKQTKAISDLRAIPWVLSWSQSRVMLPGWYG